MSAELRDLRLGQERSPVPSPATRHRGAPAETGDQYALQAQRTEVHSGRLPFL